MFDLGSTVYCDTSFLVATINSRDQYHDIAMNIHGQAIIERVIYFTSWDVIDETATLLLVRGHASMARDFVKRVVPCLEIIDVDGAMRKDIVRYFLKFNSGRRVILFTDVTSYVIVKTKLHGIPILSFDRDFISLGLRVVGVQ